ncbi:MAG: hypothetical protein L3J08_08455 [Flavobacteriaceae bacterium]|nr:hypothetical protein [Flavobacteriaceae bacterium]
MNDILVILYEIFFDWNTYQDLIKYVFNNFDFGKIGWVLLLVPLIILFVFYKFWEPMRRQRLMWVITVIVISIIAYATTSGILYNNNSILQHIGNYTGDGGPDADYFIFQMSMISALYAFILSFLESMIIKNISTNNSHNPF